jgi:hypothetical protein
LAFINNTGTVSYTSNSSLLQVNESYTFTGCIFLNNNADFVVEFDSAGLRIVFVGCVLDFSSVLTTGASGEVEFRDGETELGSCAFPSPTYASETLPASTTLPPTATLSPRVSVTGAESTISTPPPTGEFTQASSAMFKKWSIIRFALFYVVVRC